jgi:hypothetical protein
MIGSNGGSGEHVYPNVVEGVVEVANAKGIKVNGDWFNVSQFRPVALPEVGAVVRLEVQPKGFINKLEVVPAMSEPLKTAGVVATERDERIARLAVLKAAAAFGASRPDLKSADVLKIADSWLAWVEGT